MIMNGKGWYAEMCKRPEWQRKRLEIMERDEWRCCRCGAENKTLTVHHWYYKRNALPWEYPNQALATLCEDCHSEVAASFGDFSGRFLDVLFTRLGADAVEVLLMGLENRHYAEDDVCTPPLLPNGFPRARIADWVHSALCWLSPLYAEDRAWLEVGTDDEPLMEETT